MKKIEIAQNDYKKIIQHCRRKLSKNFYDGETKEQQAFGIIIGKKENEKIVITRVEPLKINYRYCQQVSDKMNNFIKDYAIPSGMKIEERAWAADPVELTNILGQLQDSEFFLGTYHMHHNASWNGKYPKQLPTDLDRKLVQNSNLVMFITYISENESTDSIRAFYEGKIELEYEIDKID